MNTKKVVTDNSYLPVAWEYRETVEEEIKKQTVGKIFFFDDTNQLEQIEGNILALLEEKGKGVFIRVKDANVASASEYHVRLDRIITLFGKVGAAYDEYDAFANACMDCKGD